MLRFLDPLPFRQLPTYFVSITPVETTRTFAFLSRHSSLMIFPTPSQAVAARLDLARAPLDACFSIV
jgi:hypothetical protein